MFPIFPLLPFKANKLFFFSDPTPNPGYMFHLVFVSLYSLSFFFKSGTAPFSLTFMTLTFLNLYRLIVPLFGIFLIFPYE